MSIESIFSEVEMLGSKEMHKCLLIARVPEEHYDAFADERSIGIYLAEGKKISVSRNHEGIRNSGFAGNACISIDDGRAAVFDIVPGYMKRYYMGRISPEQRRGCKPLRLEKSRWTYFRENNETGEERVFLLTKDADRITRGQYGLSLDSDYQLLSGESLSGLPHLVWSCIESLPDRIENSGRRKLAARSEIYIPSEDRAAIARYMIAAFKKIGE